MANPWDTGAARGKRTRELLEPVQGLNRTRNAEALAAVERALAGGPLSDLHPNLRSAFERAVAGSRDDLQAMLAAMYRQAGDRSFAARAAAEDRIARYLLTAPKPTFEPPAPPAPAPKPRPKPKPKTQAQPAARPAPAPAPKPPPPAPAPRAPIPTVEPGFMAKVLKALRKLF